MISESDLTFSRRLHDNIYVRKVKDRSGIIMSTDDVLVFRMNLSLPLTTLSANKCKDSLGINMSYQNSPTFISRRGGIFFLQVLLLLLLFGI